MREELQEQMHALLNNFWILKKDNMDLYYSIKRNQQEIRDFTIKNLGSRLIIHDKFIKLEKIPTIPSGCLGIKSFTLPTDYVFLCIILLFLEDKSQGTYFTLSTLIEYTKSTMASMELTNIPDWKLGRDRKSFKRAIDYLISIGVVDLKDQSKTDFTSDENANALYISTGLSNYVMKVFNNEIFEYKDVFDFVKDEWSLQDEDKGDIRKYKIYRNILYTPVVFSKYLSYSELDYLKRLRGHMIDEIMDNLNLELEVTRNMALVFDYEEKRTVSFPNNQAICKIVLLINSAILEAIKNSKIDLDEFEVGKISKDELFDIINSVKNDKSGYLTAGLKVLSDEMFFNTLTEYMENLSFIKREGDLFLILPAIRLFVGRVRENDKKQLDIFGS